MIIQGTTGVETPSQEDQAHVDAMVAKAEQGTSTNDQPQALYAGKYKTIEELEKGYQELNKAFSQRGKPQPEEITPPSPPPQEPDLDIPQQTIGLDFNSFNQEWQESGQLSEESYERLTKAGIPKEFVDAYIEGQQLKANSLVTRVYDTAGGQEEYTKLTTWASKNLTPQEVSAYNEVVNSGDIEKVIIATRGLKATFEMKHGRTPSLLQGDTSGDISSSSYFSSTAQVKEAMSDPRYQKDPAYRDEVAKKLSRSSIF